MTRKPLLLLILSLISLLPVLTGTAFGSIIPTLKETLELENIQVSLIIATSTLVTVLVSPLLGRISDKFQPHRVIQVLLIFYIIGALINSSTMILKEYSYGIFVAGRLFQGFGNVGAGPIAISLVKNLSEESSSNQNIAFIESFTSMGAVIGPVVGGMFALFFWKGLFLFDMVVMTILIILLSVLLSSKGADSMDKSTAKLIDEKELPHNGKVKWVAYLGGFGLMFSLIGMQSFLVDYLIKNYDMSVLWGGVIVSAHALLMALTAALSGRHLSKRILGKLINIGLGIFAGAMIIVGLKVNLMLTIAVIILSGIGCGLILPSGNILIIANSDRQEQSFAVSLFASSRSLGVLMGSFLLGAISTYINYQWMFITSGIILFGIFIYSIYTFSVSKQVVFNELN